MAGFDAEESLLPYDRRSTDGYRLLQEYFTFPEKFLFFDLGGLEPLARAGFGNQAEIVFLFSKFERAERQQGLELGVNARTFRLGCTPAINLFKQTAEPILLSQTKHEYTIVPDSRHSAMMEIFSIEEVVAANPKLRQSVVLEPMHAYRHQTRSQSDRLSGRLHDTRTNWASANPRYDNFGGRSNRTGYRPRSRRLDRSHALY